MSLYIDRLPKGNINLMVADDYDNLIEFKKARLEYNTEINVLYLYPEGSAVVHLNHHYGMTTDAESAMLGGCAMLRGVVSLAYNDGNRTHFLGYWMIFSLGSSSVYLESPANYYRRLEEHELADDSE